MDNTNQFFFINVNLQWESPTEATKLVTEFSSPLLVFFLGFLMELGTLSPCALFLVTLFLSSTNSSSNLYLRAIASFSVCFNFFCILHY